MRRSASAWRLGVSSPPPPALRPLPSLAAPPLRPAVTALRHCTHNKANVCQTQYASGRIFSSLPEMHSPAAARHGRDCATSSQSEYLAMIS